jgi:hypothetical protein
MFLNTTSAQVNGTTVWSSSAATSTVFNVGTAGVTNQPANNFVAYCWAEVPDYSRFGSYVGNGSVDAPFVYCGFRPEYVLIKNMTGASGNWVIHDTTRDPFNLAGRRLAANLSNQEGETGQLGNNTTGMDILSNGFKLRVTGNNHNNSAENYIFAAFAETPFKYARAR